MTGTRAAIERAGPGVAARLQSITIRSAAFALHKIRKRGLSRVIALTSHYANPGNFILFRLDTGARLKVGIGDDYWLVPLLREGSYEPEIARVLRRVIGPEAAFIDCGANIGYWSALMAAAIGRPGRVVAIEIARDAFEQLATNAQLNHGAFECVHAAAWDHSGDTIIVAVDPSRHSWSSAAPEVRAQLEEAGFGQESVGTITVDDVSSKYLEGDPSLVVLKVDVEGAEINVLRGAQRTLERNTLVVYEDHGRELGSEISSYVLGDLGLAVFYPRPSGKVERMQDLSAIQSVKVERATGYNFLACREGTPVYSQLTSLGADPGRR